MYTVRRIVSGLLLIGAVGIAMFFLTHFAVRDPAAAILGTSAQPEQLVALNTRLGLDRPLLVQFWEWFRGLLVGDLGTSWSTSRPVLDEVLLRAPVTLSIVVFAIVLTAVLGSLIGLLAGLKPGSWFDYVSKSAQVILFALPGFLVSLALIMWFAIGVPWFPAVGYTPPTVSIGGWLHSITLPAVSLALSGVVAVAEQLRNAVLTVSREDYIRTLRTRGVGDLRVRMHILRNASPAALTVLALMFVALVSGAVVVEAIFSIPGIGQLTTSASSRGDIPMLLGITVISVVFVVIIYVILDLILGWVNPKVRKS